MAARARPVYPSSILQNNLAAVCKEISSRSGAKDMKMGKFSQLVTVGVLTLVAGGLSGCWRGGPFYREYDNRFWNASDSEMSDVTITWTTDGEHYRQGGNLMSPNRGGSMGISWAFSPHPIPEKVLAHWVTSDGKVHEKIVEVARHIPDPECFTGAIVYKFYDDDVVIEPMGSAVQDRNHMLGKGTVP